MRILIIFCCLTCSIFANPSNTWNEFSAILKPSSIHGIGVFATHDIKAGTAVFTQWSKEWRCKKAKYKEVPKKFHKYCIPISERKCYRPQRFDRLEVWFYLNHSKDANIEENEHGDWYAIRDIRAGEELLFDYHDDEDE